MSTLYQFQIFDQIGVSKEELIVGVEESIQRRAELEEFEPISYTLLKVSHEDGETKYTVQVTIKEKE